MTDEDNELISIVTPVYNAAEFLPRLYGCLRAQSYGRWEWVVVNDGSTDGSGAMLRRWADADGRIIYRECPNSGSAKQPRDMAVALASSRMVLCIDADDYVADDYVRTMYERKTATGADIVYPVMRSIAGGTVLCELPAAGIDRRRVCDGRSLVRETLDGWRIGCVGGLYDKALWTALSHSGDGTAVWMNSDELDERLFLVRAGRVAFADTYYYYVANDLSITQRFSPKQFQRLRTDSALKAFVCDEFGAQSHEYALAARQMFRTWRHCMALYAIHRRSLGPSREAISARLRESLADIDVSVLTACERLQFLNLHCFGLLSLLFRIRYSAVCLFHDTGFMRPSVPRPAAGSAPSDGDAAADDRSSQ